jgi:transposase
MTIVADRPPTVETNEVTAGVDTHADAHVAAVIDPLGRHLGHESFPATPAGYRAPIAWITTFGAVARVGVEGTGAYGAGGARALGAADFEVVEVDRPDRKARRDQGKSDPIDAYAVARAAAGGRASGTPKSRTGDVESVRALRVARNGAIRARAKALTQLKALIVTAPEALRTRLDGLDGDRLIGSCARLRPARDEPAAPSPHAKRAPRPGRLVDPTAATKRALAGIAGRAQRLDVELAELDGDLHVLLTPLAPTLLGLMGVGLDVAGRLLATTGDNPDRLHGEAAFAHLCGAAPIPASSGKTTRHRLNRGGDRAANAALYRIVICRLRWDPATRAYVERRTKEGRTKEGRTKEGRTKEGRTKEGRTKEGRTKAEIIRCLKRYIAREVFTAIRADLCPRIP